VDALRACTPELQALAVEHDLPDGVCADTRLSQDLLTSYLARMGYGHAYRRPPVPTKPSFVERAKSAAHPARAPAAHSNEHCTPAAQNCPAVSGGFPL
jgi:hypothetical protein